MSAQAMPRAAREVASRPAPQTEWSCSLSPDGSADRIPLRPRWRLRHLLDGARRLRLAPADQRSRASISCRASRQTERASPSSRAGPASSSCTSPTPTSATSATSRTTRRSMTASWASLGCAMDRVWLPRHRAVTTHRRARRKASRSVSRRSSLQAMLLALALTVAFRVDPGTTGPATVIGVINGLLIALGRARAAVRLGADRGRPGRRLCRGALSRDGEASARRY